MKKNNSHIALGAHYKHLKWTFIPNGSSIFILMQQEKKKFLSYRCPLYTEFSYWDFTNRHIFVYPQMEFLS